VYIRDTIAAVATPPGEGAIAVVRLSGPAALEIAAAIFRRPTHGDLESHRFYYGEVADPTGGTLVDEVMLVAMRAPRSYTREDVVEIHCHGGAVPVRLLFELLLRSGARPAEPGEFTRRAFLNGRIDLTQAESVLDVIRAKSDVALARAHQQRTGLLGQRLAAVTAALVRSLAFLEATLDFPEDEVDPAVAAAVDAGIEEGRAALSALLQTFGEGRVLHDGVSVLIAGVPNVGKSSLLNALLQEERAIVTAIPGTTRDIIEDRLTIDGLQVRLLDSAGIRETADPVEQVGVRIVRDRLATVDLVLLVLDGSRPVSDEELALAAELGSRPLIVVRNKADLEQCGQWPASLSPYRTVAVSARGGEGVQGLKSAIHDTFVSREGSRVREALFLTNRRHADLVGRALDALGRCREARAAGMPAEIGALELRLAVDHLGEITGATSTDDLLDVIFGAFCVGK
jgi:tRNA modification GTPase